MRFQNEREEKADQDAGAEWKRRFPLSIYPRSVEAPSWTTDEDRAIAKKLYDAALARRDLTLVVLQDTSAVVVAGEPPTRLPDWIQIMEKAELHNWLAERTVARLAEATPRLPSVPAPPLLDAVPGRENLPMTSKDAGREGRGAGVGGADPFGLLDAWKSAVTGEQYLTWIKTNRYPPWWPRVTNLSEVEDRIAFDQTVMRESDLPQRIKDLFAWNTSAAALYVREQRAAGGEVVAV